MDKMNNSLKDKMFLISRKQKIYFFPTANVFRCVKMIYYSFEKKKKSFCWCCFYSNISTD